MNRLLQNRLLLQLLFTFVAALSVAALSLLVITEAIRGADRFVIAQANDTLANATRELKQQYQYRATFDPSWSALPEPAQDLSLRAITQTVLRSYPGVEGGFYSNSHFLGYAYPTHDTGSAKVDVPAAEESLLVSLARKTLQTSSPVQQVVRGRVDFLVLRGVRDMDHGLAVWTMKRLPGRGAADSGHRNWLLGGLGAAALISIVGTLATGISLARGVNQIKRGLAALEHNFDWRLPERSDELGKISQSINQMADTRRKLEVDLRREDRLRALGRLAAGLAHEIRNPLNSIQLTLQLLEQKLRQGSLRREDFLVVKAEVNRLNTLVSDLLDLQRTRPPSPEFQPIAPVVQHCIGLVQREAEVQGVNILLETAESCASALFDSRHLTQALVNLLLNASEASARGDVVQVSVCERDGRPVIQVRDNGPGLDAAQEEHLFEPFYTTKVSGTGLGLAVSRELMRSQGGDLTYRRCATGACFILQLATPVSA